MARGNGKLDPCVRSLRDAAEVILSEDFPVELTLDGELVSSFQLGREKPLAFTYRAACRRGHVEAVAGIQGVDSLLEGVGAEQRVRILEAILRIPYDYGVTVSMPDPDTMLLTFAWEEEVDRANFVGATYTFSLLIASWLREQAARALQGLPPEPFHVE